MEKNAVTIVGSINYDIILKQKRLPEIGETFTADSVTFCGGGKGANQAVQCAKLGLESYMVGKVGNDQFGSELIATMKKYGLNTDYVSKADTNTGLGIVNAISDGSVVATIAKGANYSMTIEDIDQVEDLLKKSKIVILQLEIPKEVVEYTIKKAKGYNCYVILNAAPACEIDVDCLKLVDCLVVNETEASFYAGERVSSVIDAEKVCRKLYLFTNNLLIITLGEKGSILYDGNKTIHIPCRTVDVVETTGAGDSYTGALAYGLMNEWPIEKIGEYASIVSSRTVTKIGAQDAMPTLIELNEYV